MWTHVFFAQPHMLSHIHIQVTSVLLIYDSNFNTDKTYRKETDLRGVALALKPIKGTRQKKMAVKEMWGGCGFVLGRRQEITGVSGGRNEHEPKATRQTL